MKFLNKRVIAPTAPKYARHGYNGSGYIGVCISETENHAVVLFGEMLRMTFHKSRLSLLTIKAKEDKP